MKTVLIIGASRGIGREMVKKFSETGYRVAFTYNNSAEAAEYLAKETGAISIRADSSVEEDVISAVKIAKDSLGRIDCLINNAGVK